MYNKKYKKYIYFNCVDYNINIIKYYFRAIQTVPDNCLPKNVDLLVRYT